MNLSDYKVDDQRDMLIAAVEQILDNLKSDPDALKDYDFVELLEPVIEELECNDYFGTEGLYHFAGLD